MSREQFCNESLNKIKNQLVDIFNRNSGMLIKKYPDIKDDIENGGVFLQNVKNNTRDTTVGELLELMYDLGAENIHFNIEYPSNPNISVDIDKYDVVEVRSYFKLLIGRIATKTMFREENFCGHECSEYKLLLKPEIKHDLLEYIHSELENKQYYRDTWVCLELAADILMFEYENEDLGNIDNCVKLAYYNIDQCLYGE
jgi:hypothetical protein